MSAGTLAEAEVDIGPLFARVELGLDATRDAVDKLRRQQHNLIPSDVPLVATGVATSSTLQAFGLGGPPQGFTWILRRWATGGTDPSVAAAGKAFLFVCAAVPVIVNGGDGAQFFTGTGFQLGAFASARDQQTALPAMGGYSSRQIAFTFPEKLFVVITGASNGQAYVTNAGVESYQDASRVSEFGL